MFVAAAIPGGWVRPCVDAVFSFDDVAKAHDYLQERKNVGKVILVPSADAAKAWNDIKATNAKK